MLNLKHKSRKKIDISCDFNQMNRLFMNILKNSIESISKKKKKKGFLFQLLKNQNLFVLMLRIMEMAFQKIEKNFLNLILLTNLMVQV